MMETSHLAPFLAPARDHYVKEVKHVVGTTEFELVALDPERAREKARLAETIRKAVGHGGFGRGEEKAREHVKLHDSITGPTMRFAVPRRFKFTLHWEAGAHLRHDEVMEAIGAAVESKQFKLIKTSDG